MYKLEKYCNRTEYQVKYFSVNGFFLKFKLPFQLPMFQKCKDVREKHSTAAQTGTFHIEIFLMEIIISLRAPGPLLPLYRPDRGGEDRLVTGELHILPGVGQSARDWRVRLLRHGRREEGGGGGGGRRGEVCW